MNTCKRCKEAEAEPGRKSCRPCLDAAADYMKQRYHDSKAVASAHRKYMRKRTGCKAWVPGRPGRPPLGAPDTTELRALKKKLHDRLRYVERSGAPTSMLEAKLKAAEPLCRRCKKHPLALHSTTRCEKCLAKEAAHFATRMQDPSRRAEKVAANQKRRGCKPWTPGKDGRPPAECKASPELTALRKKRHVLSVKISRHKKAGINTAFLEADLRITKSEIIYELSQMQKTPGRQAQHKPV